MDQNGRYRNLDEGAFLPHSERFDSVKSRCTTMNDMEQSVQFVVTFVVQ